MIIKDGILEGKINEYDSSDNQRNISIPINYKDGKLSGTISINEFLKYPYPIFPRLKLSKEDL